MSLTTTLGGPKSGYFELVANPRVCDDLSRKAKANPANASKVEEFNEGEWAIFDANGELNKSNSGNPETLAYPVLTGKERSDCFATGHYAIRVGHGWHLRTNAFFLGGAVTSASYATPGTLLKVKNGLLEPAASGEFALARVVKGVETVQLESEKVVGKAGWSTITVEVGPCGKA